MPGRGRNIDCRTAPHDGLPSPGEFWKKTTEFHGGQTVPVPICVTYSVRLLKSIIGQNIIILFSDGEDNSSAIDPYTLMKIVERSNSVIYSIGRHMDDYNQYQDLLKKIAHSSGGMPFFFQEVEDIQKLYRKIRQDIQAKYILQFAPKDDKKRNRFRKVTVSLTPAAESRIGKSCTVRTMKGYYY